MPFYAVVFYKAWYGTRFKIVLSLIGLLFVANFFFADIALARLRLDTLFHTEKGITEEELSWARWLETGVVIGFTCYNEAHWFLAFFYFKMAKNMPRVIREEPTKSYKGLNWLGIAFNALIPIANGTFTIMLIDEIKEDKEKQP